MYILSTYLYIYNYIHHPPNQYQGMYQHSIHQLSELQRRLEEVVESCVSEVGADLNTASEHILKFVSGNIFI